VRSAAPRRWSSRSNARRALRQASLAWGVVASFFIDTDTGQVATLRQLDEAGVVSGGKPPPPWFPIQGTRDAITMWYAVMRKPVRDKYIGALCIRHSDHHASLMEKGWEEVAVEEIRATRCTPER
jgi:hypothetical protein